MELQPGGDAGDKTLTRWDQEGLAGLVEEVRRVQGQKHAAGRHKEDLENTTERVTRGQNSDQQQKCYQKVYI